MKGKKFLALVMAAAMTMSLAACGDDSDPGQDSSGSSTQQSESKNDEGNADESGSTRRKAQRKAILSTITWDPCLLTGILTHGRPMRTMP